MIIDEVSRALIYLLCAGIVSVAWTFARDAARDVTLGRVLWKGFLWCLGIALIANVNLGASSCLDSEPGLVGNECTDYSDDEFEPTAEERWANFAFFMTLLYTPVLLGAWRGSARRDS